MAVNLTVTLCYTYSLFGIVKITNIWEFFHEYSKKKSETLTEFCTILVQTRIIKVICCAAVAKNQQKITYDREYSIAKSWDLKYMNF